MIRFLNYFRESIGSDLLYQLIASAAIIIVSVIVSKILSLLTKKIISPFVKKSPTSLDDKLLSIVETGLFKLLIIGGVYLGIENLKSRTAFLLPDVKINLSEEYPYIDKLLTFFEALLYIALVFIFLIITYKVITIIFDWYAEKIHAAENRDISGSLFPLLKKVVKIIVAAVVVVLSKFDVNISGLLVSLGVGSLAIALAAQDTISNMIAGFILMIDRPFRIGDRIRFADNRVGDVVSIGIRSTKILDFDNNLVIIPINEMVKSSIINITYPNILTRDLIEVGVVYRTDIEKAREVMLRSANQHPLVSKRILPEVFLMNFGESSVDLRLAVRTDDYRNAFSIQVQLRERIYNEIIKEGIKIPFPQRVVHFPNDSQKNNQ